MSQLAAPPPADSEAASPYYIGATPAAAYRPRVLKAADTFLVVDPYGDAQAVGPGAEGLFHRDTRYLSNLTLLVGGERPLLLSSTVSEDNVLFAADLTNPDLVLANGRQLPRDSLHILRSKLLEPGLCLERLELRNYGSIPVELPLVLGFGADFRDIFEVRGQTRPRRGRALPEQSREDCRILAYQGLDEAVRRLSCRFDPAPDAWLQFGARFALRIAPGETLRIEVAWRCELGPEATAPADRFAPGDQFDEAVAAARRRHTGSVAAGVHLHSSSERFNNWLSRARADLDMLTTVTPHGRYPYAGIPWFSCPFGRDGLITALQCLWLDPELAQGTLAYLAACQATTLDPAADAEPGKILHETREGEMAALGEVPFGRYYGSIDSTPLFVLLAAAYVERTGDWPLIARLWPNVEAALDWMRDHGDRDGDGFLEYEKRTEKGLANQGWKDSEDSVFHADGRLAEPPIALAEVQAYAYGAWTGAARLAEHLGRPDRAQDCRDRARRLQERFEAAFWCEELGTYALALDGAKRPCRVRSSNAGQALLTGLAAPARAARVAEMLMQPDLFSEWGIRTIAEGEARYNPMSYHNGSVWPHDNGLIGMGFARYGFTDRLVRLFSGLFDASVFMDLHRLPELFCGFPRRFGEGPTGYPVACIPQAWSSAVVFALLGSMLGARFQPGERQIRFVRPVMPIWLDELRLDNLRLGDASVDLLFRRHIADVSLNVLAKRGEVEIVQVG